MRNKPNFFVVGGPKCGTTAMVEYLRTHPDIFISEPKEPNYLADNMPEMKFVKSEKEYLRLFNKASNNKVVGDASILYMYSKTAIKNIYRLNPKAKLLVMIRNPLEMANSFHKQILFTLDEDEPDFEKALALEYNRKNGKRIPKNCREEKLLYYSEIAKYGEQLENIYNFFPKENVLVLLFDDFKKSNRESYLKVLSFLDLKDDGRRDFPRINDAKKPKSTFINKLVNRPPKIALYGARLLRKILNKPRLGILNTIDHKNRVKLTKEPLSEETKKKLTLLYQKDVEMASRILNRDLDFWFK